MPTRLKTLAKTKAPQSDDEVNDYLDKIAELSTRMDKLRADAQQEIVETRANLAEELKAPAEELEELKAGVEIYCTANRDRLTDNGKRKFKRFVSGLIQWRQRPPSVTLRGKEGVMKALKEGGKKMSKFIRTKQEINKEAMLADPELAQTVDGVSIKTVGEDFVIEPAAMQREEAA